MNYFKTIFFPFNNINGKLLWTLYEGNNLDNEYKNIVLEGIKTKKEKLSIDVFKKICKIRQ